MSRTAELWTTYVSWLARSAPEAHANLAPPASEAALANVEARLGVLLPDDVKTVLRKNDGQLRTMTASHAAPAPVCLPSLSFLSTTLIIEVWEEWERLRRETATDELSDLQAAGRSAQPGVVRALYTHPGWVPLWADPTRADYVGADLDPDEKGTSGQIINFGRNEERHFRFATSYEELLAFLVDEVTSGKWNKAVMRAGDSEVAWLGEPSSHFFNALHARWKSAQSPTAQTSTPQQRLAELERTARRAMMSGDMEEALTAAMEAEALFPAHTPILVLVAEIAIALGRFEEAEQRYALVTAKAPRQVQHLYARVENLVDGLGDRGRAAELLRARLATHASEKATLALLDEVTKT